MGRTPSILVRGIALVGLAACSVEPERQTGWRPIEDPASFYVEAVGRKLVSGEDHIVFLNDGRIAGFYDGAALTGNWRWDDDRLCRTASIGARRLYPDCQLVAVDGDRLRIVRENGAGSTVVYSIE
ncbi:MAG: hypothetical protein ACFBWO_17215 [Paracoccaceae bacterium]